MYLTPKNISFISVTGPLCSSSCGPHGLLSLAYLNGASELARCSAWSRHSIKDGCGNHGHDYYQYLPPMSLGGSSLHRESVERISHKGLKLTEVKKILVSFTAAELNPQNRRTIPLSLTRT